MHQVQTAHNNDAAHHPCPEVGNLTEDDDIEGHRADKMCVVER
jgi:hypothetical protein